MPYTWSEEQPVGDVDSAWFGVKVSDDGTRILVCQEEERVFFSTDSCVTWPEVRPAGDFDKDWQQVDMSSDGTILLGSQYTSSSSGRIYRSIDSGANWSELQPVGNLNKVWTLARMSGNGTLFVCGIFNGRLYRSVNSGSSWAEIKPAGAANKYWSLGKISADGQTIVVGWYSNGKLYLSTNGGTNWAEIQPAGAVNRGWSFADISADGNVIFVGCTPTFGGSGGLYLSINKGASWDEVRPIDGDDGYYWYAGALNSTDGSVLVAGIGDLYLGRAYVSRDTGGTWEEIQPAGDFPRWWLRASMSADGSLIVMGESEGRLFSGVWAEPEPPAPGGEPSDNGTYIAAVIHGDPIEVNTNTLKSQTTIRTTWELPFVWQFIECPPDGIVDYRRIRTQTTAPFWTGEKSLTSSQPIELHMFSTPSTVWRYADSPIDIEYIGDGVRTFRGSVIDVSFEQTSRVGEREVIINAEPFVNDMRTSGLTWSYNLSCAVALYSPACGILRTTVTPPGPYVVTGALTDITNNTILTAVEFATKADGWFVGGDIVIGNYRRKIMSHSGSTIVMSWRIPDIAIGSAFSAYAGCNRTREICIAKFDNLNNFRGCPLIPDVNPTEKAII